MAGQGHSSSARTPTGTELIGTWIIEDVVEGSNDVSSSTSADRKLGLSLVVKRPGSFIKIAHQVTTTAISYPHDGDGIVDLVQTGPDRITLDEVSGTPVPTTIDLTGCLIVIVAGTGVGEVRRITAYNTTTRIATVNRAASPIIAGDTYRVLVPAFLRTRLRLKGEASAAAVSPTLLVQHYGFPRSSGSSPTAIKPVVTFEGPIILPALDTWVGQNIETEETNYYHLGEHARDVEGSIGFKIRLQALPSGSLSLWACTV